LKPVSPPAPPETKTVKEPADLTLMLGLAAPAEVITAVRRMIEVAVAREFVTVVLDPVTAT
jgi:hypothetical protein